MCVAVRPRLLPHDRSGPLIIGVRRLAWSRIDSQSRRASSSRSRRNSAYRPQLPRAAATSAARASSSGNAGPSTPSASHSCALRDGARVRGHWWELVSWLRHRQLSNPVHVAPGCTQTDLKQQPTNVIPCQPARPAAHLDVAGRRLLHCLKLRPHALQLRQHDRWVAARPAARPQRLPPV